MVWNKAKSESSGFEKMPVAGVIIEYSVTHSVEKPGMESLKLILDAVDLKTLKPLNKERTVFLFMNSKNWKVVDDEIVIPWYSEANGLITAAGAKGCEAMFDTNQISGDDVFTSLKINDIQFEPDIIGAYVRLGIRESQKEGLDKIFKNYTVEDFNLNGIPATKRK